MAPRWISARPAHPSRAPRWGLTPACESLEQRELLSILPPNFSETVVASGINQPTAMEFAPDGRLFVAQQTGQLRVIKNGQLLAQPFLSLNVDSNGERGLLGVAFDPNFTANQYVYVYYTVPGSPAHNRVSRFTANGDVALTGSEVDLLDVDPLSADTRHNGGAIHFGPDGDLYIGVGDNKNGANSQSLSSLKGKILRIRPDGTIPPDNPFFNQTSGVDQAIWAMGLRNPYTFAFGLDSQGVPRMLINDVGENTWEKIDPGIAGANYGWPITENATGSTVFTNPLFVYDHGVNDANGCAITGGTFYDPAVVEFPSSYIGTYFFSDLCGNWIHQFDPVTKTETNFGSQLPGNTVDLKVDAAGRLYYLSGAGTSDGLVVRIDYSTQPPPPPPPPPPTGNPPTIVSQPSSETLQAGQTAFFSVLATGTGNLTYQWQRNGRSISGAVLSSYTLPGVKASDNGAVFSVMVSNSFGSVSSGGATLTVQSPQPPVPLISSPAAGSLFEGGQTIDFSGSATDPQDGQLPASALSWQIEWHDGANVTRLGSPISGTDSGSFTVPQTGGLNPTGFYRIILVAVDSSGFAGVASVDVNPHVTHLGLSTQNAGVPLVLDGQQLSTPAAVPGVAGMFHQLQAPPSAIVGGVIYAFAGWSDGVAQAVRSLVFPSADASLTAVYTVAGIVPYVTVPSARLNVARGAIRSISVSFQGVINATSAKSRTAYWLVLPGRDRVFGTRDDRYSRFRAVSFSAAAGAATLVPATRLTTRQSFEVIVSGAGARGMAVDIYGRPIDGNGDGQPGSDAVFRFVRGSTSASPLLVRAGAAASSARRLRSP
jgi:glucose/arabinose dehydrogenase